MVFGFGRKKQQNAAAPVAAETSLPSVYQDQNLNANVTSVLDSALDVEPAQDGGAGHTSAAGHFAPTIQRRDVNVIEMLEFARNLEIDPVKESEMLWIAEEAFQAELPPGWLEHTDEGGRVYFHNASTGESCWQHPMEHLFLQITEYWRRVHHTGGFWEVEDELAEIEEQIRKDLQDWMELFDEHGDKFFFNRRSEETRHDDPRHAVYHDMYARIRLLAKMKEHAPLLARVPRPVPPTQAELDLQRRQEEEEQRHFDSVIKVQSWARTMLAASKVKAMRQNRNVDKGHQPLRHCLQLRVEKVPRSAQRALVLSEPAEVKSKKAAARKIQARFRGIEARNKTMPVIRQRMFVEQKVKMIQRRARKVLEAKREAERERQRPIIASNVIKSYFRVFQARGKVQDLHERHLRFLQLHKCAIKIQSMIRMQLALRRVRRKRAEFEDGQVAIMQKFAKVFLAQRHVIKCEIEDLPFDFQLIHTDDHNPRMQRLMPFSWQLLMHPLDEEGQSCDYPNRPRPYDLFYKSGVAGMEVMAATKIQAMIRGFLAKRRAERRRRVSAWLKHELFTGACGQYSRRRMAAILIQKRARGFLVRRRDVLGERYKLWLQKIVPTVVKTEAYMLRYGQWHWWSTKGHEGMMWKWAAFIQARWRGNLARRQYARMKEEVMWPVKGWFEYTGMGSDTCRVDVQFFGNPRFDEYKWFSEHGDFNDLAFRLERMEEETAKIRPKTKKELAQEAKEKRKKEKAQKKAAEEKEKAAQLAAEIEKADAGQPVDAEGAQAGAEDQDKSGAEGSQTLGAAIDEATDGGIAATAQGAAPAEGSEEQPSGLDAGVQEAPPSEELKPQQSPSGTGAADGATAAAATTEAVQGAAGTTEISDPASLDPASPSALGEWSPRRGHLGPGIAARERSEKERPAQKEHPLVERAASQKDVTSPMAAAAGKVTGFGRTNSKAGLASEQAGEPETKPAEIEGQVAKEPRSPTQVLKDAAAQRSSPPVSPSSPPASSTAPRKHYGGTFKNGQFVKTNKQRLEDLTEEEKAQVMADLVEERKRKIEQLVRRQKVHQTRRRKDPQREVQKLGRSAVGQPFEEEHRKTKVRELKAWIKSKESNAQVNLPEISPMDKLHKLASKAPGTEKLWQDQQEFRERRTRIGEQRRMVLAQSMPTLKRPGRPDQQLNRHVHHHVHYHDGAVGEESDEQMMHYHPMGGMMAMMQSSSAPGLPFAADSQMPTHGSPWRPMGHQAFGQTMPPQGPSYGNLDPYAMSHTAASFPAQSWPSRGLQEASMGSEPGKLPALPLGARQGIRT